MPGARASSLGPSFCRAEETVALFPLCTFSRGSGAHLAPDEEGRRRVHGRRPRPQRESVPAARHLGNAIGAGSHRGGQARSPGRRALATTHAYTNRQPAQVGASSLARTRTCFPTLEGSGATRSAPEKRSGAKDRELQSFLGPVALVPSLSGLTRGIIAPADRTKDHSGQKHLSIIF